MKYTKYLYIFFLIIIFFGYGLILSEIIDYIFPDHDEKLPHYRIVIEIIGEIGVAYIIFFSLKKYSERMINNLFNIVGLQTPSYLNQLLLFAFSSGIFKYLDKSGKKIVFMRKKIINI